MLWRCVKKLYLWTLALPRCDSTRPNVPLAQEAALCEQPAPLTCEDTSIPKKSSSPQSLERNEFETFRKVTDFSDALSSLIRFSCAFKRVSAARVSARSCRIWSNSCASRDSGNSWTGATENHLRQKNTKKHGFTPIQIHINTYQI